MAEYVRMPQSHYVAALNSIRAKTGKTDLIKSGEMSAEIDSIATGGGSSADVRYVTFMSYDGAEEHGKKAVAYGDDCADPIARGIFNTPTRASTAQYDYTFYNWADTLNGGANPNWYKSITEDKTVYANFAAVVRCYTITYLDTDGSTLNTETLPYDSTPSYAPTKEAYLFNGWNPAVTAVTGDATYTAEWIAKPLFSTASWEEIGAICEAGNAASVFNIGDTKMISIPYFWSGAHKGSAEAEFQIVGFNVEDCENGGKAAMTIASSYALDRQYLGSDKTSDMTIKGKGWENCVARSNLNTTVIAKFPSDLQPLIKSVKKVSNAVGSASASANVTTIDKLWIPSITEYGLTYYETAPSQGYNYPRLYNIRKTPGLTLSGTLEGDTLNNSEYITHNTRSDSTDSSKQIAVNHLGDATNPTGPMEYARLCFCI